MGIIEKSVKGKVFEIHLQNPVAMNALTIPEFVELADALNEANDNRETTVTLLTSSGTFFSTGANIKSISQLTNRPKLEYYEQVTSKNILLVHTFLNHRKLLITALNGPAVGLSAALVNLTDILWARKVVAETKSNQNPYYYFPFSSIGLVNECGASVSLPHRLGLSVAIDAICLCKRIPFETLHRLGLFSHVIETDSVQEFNDKVRSEVLTLVRNLDDTAILENKSQLTASFKQKVKQELVDESLMGLQKWVEEKPQNAFRRMVQSKRDNKL